MYPCLKYLEERELYAMTSTNIIYSYSTKLFPDNSFCLKDCRSGG